MDLSGFSVTQTKTADGSNKVFAFPASTVVGVGKSVVVARSSTQAAFEAFYGEALPEGTVFLDAEDAFLTINTDTRTYTLKNSAGTVVDGPSVVTQNGKTLQRNVPVGPAGEAASWTAVAASTTASTPGVQPAGGSYGCAITEIADAVGNGAFVVEFVEVTCDRTP